MKPALFLLLLFSFNTFAQQSECDTGVLKTTLECHASELKKAEIELNKVTNFILSKHQSDKLFLDSFNKAESTWEQSLKLNCGAVYDIWRHGSVKNIKWLQCKYYLTKERIGFLNQEFMLVQ